MQSKQEKPTGRAGATILLKECHRLLGIHSMSYTFWAGHCCSGRLLRWRRSLARGFGGSC